MSNCECIENNTPLPIRDYLEHWISCISRNEELIKEQFENIKNPDCYTRDKALELHNVPKNRYVELAPYDYNRVKLKNISNQCASDYINASYINDYNGNLKYIASQAPTKHTVHDFWSMIVNENIQSIVSLTRIDKNENESKCYPYWHDTNEVTHGEYTVRCTSKKNFNEWVERTLTATDQQGNTFIVNHIHFTEWPDLGVPSTTTSVLKLIEKLNSITKTKQSPLLVHCTAGIGRSGTLISLDLLLEMASRHEKIFHVKSLINFLRHQRIDMVETFEQYKFIFQTIYDKFEHMKESQADFSDNEKEDLF